MNIVDNNKPVTAEARRFKEFRKAENLTQIQIGEKLGKDQATIQRYEKGTFAIPIEIVKLMHEKFLMSLDWFFLGKGSRLYVPMKGNLVTDIKAYETNQSILMTQVEGLKKEFLKLHNEFYELKSKTAVHS
jgi:transcriptional regulator with XRE-family HTH domain